MYCISSRDGKMTIFFGPARPVVPFFSPARPIIQFLILGPFGPVWARLGPRQNLLSLLFYNKTTNTTEIKMLIGF